jgi:hypothetical protein
MRRCVLLVMQVLWSESGVAIIAVDGLALLSK